MHFWIDKRSQGCGYNGRHWVPPSISGSRRNQRLLCGGVHPKLMVTPVHRFQSIESVASGGIRHPRTPGYNTRYPLNVHPPVHCNVSNSTVRSTNTGVSNSLELLSNEQNQTSTLRHTPATKLKSFIWAFFAVFGFMLAGVFWYYHGAIIGVQALVICSLAVILVVGLLVSFYESWTKAQNIYNSSNAPTTNQMANEQNEPTEEIPNQVPNSIAPHVPQLEMPPPPYHVAIMLPSQADTESLSIIRDSPPPSYDKAVT